MKLCCSATDCSEVYDRFMNRKMSAIGACIGAIVGLVAITPAAGFVTLGQSVFIGFIAAIISNIAIRLTKKSNIDDTLDVFPSHGVGGIVGMILTAIFAKEGRKILLPATTATTNDEKKRVL